jgi:predicted solute-binding protein
MASPASPPKLRIGVVNYLNAYPLWAAMDVDDQLAATEIHSDKLHAKKVASSDIQSRVELVRGVPSYLAAELHAGCLDAALISSVEYLRHPMGLVYHSNLCIAATRESESIRLFLPDATQPFSAALEKTRTIYTDIASRSSVAQLKILLHELGMSPALEEIAYAGERITTLHSGEALLTIGDTALAHRHEPSYDLQREYFEILRHGFVYALWVMRSEKSRSLEPILSAAYNAYKANISLYLNLATERFGFPPEFTQKYLRETIEHDLSPERQADLKFFAEKLVLL